MKKVKWTSVLIIVIPIIIVMFLLWAYCFIQHTNQNQPEGTVTNNALITEKRTYGNGESCTLYVTWDEIHDAIIPVSAATKIYDVNGKRITGDQLKEGDLISVRGEGRFRFLGAGDQTKKGRIVVEIEKYL